MEARTVPLVFVSADRRPVADSRPPASQPPVSVGANRLRPTALITETLITKTLSRPMTSSSRLLGRKRFQSLPVQFVQVIV